MSARLLHTRLGYLVYVCVAWAVLLELMLQATALVVYLTHADRTAKAGAAAGILCIGDSFTYGSGASRPENAYPMVLERVLEEEHGLHLPVVNAGVPGRNSRDVLLHLEDQLRRTQPAILTILVGINDRWARPELLRREEVPPSADRFIFRWRIPRLLSLLRAANDDRGDARGAPPDALRGPRAPTPTMLAAADRLLREAGIAPGSRTPHALAARPAEIESLLAETEEVLRKGDFVRAKRHLLDHRDDAPPHPAVLSLLAKVHVKLGERREALAVIEPLREAFARHASGETAAALLNALLGVGLWAEADVVSRRALEKFPDLPDAWRVQARVAWVRDQESAAMAFKRYIELSDERHPRFLGRIARVTARTQPERAIRILAAAWLMARNVGVVRAHVSTVARAVPVERLDALRGRADLDEVGRRALAQLRAEMYAPQRDPRYLEILRQHLGTVQSLAHERGVRTVVLSYPTPRGPSREMYRSVAEEGGSVYAPVAERFERELRVRPRGELFVADGHCNDVGYEIVAETVAEAIAGSLSDL